MKTTLGDRVVWNVAAVTRLTAYVVVYAVFFPWTPSLHSRLAVVILTWAFFYSGALLLVSVRRLNNENRGLWLAFSLVLDLLTVAALQWQIDALPLQVVYLFTAVFYFLLARGWGIAACAVATSVALVGVDLATGRLAQVLPLDLLCALLLLGEGLSVGFIASHLRRRSEQLQLAVITDDLTGLFNARHLFQRLEQEVRRVERSGSVSSLALFDADNFKEVNDRLGHLSGDRLLQRTAQAMLASIRASDLAFRYGGDEFAVLLPDTDREGARLVLQRVARSMEEAACALIGPDIPVRHSYGCADTRQSVDVETLFRLADEDLYAHKPPEVLHPPRRADRVGADSE